MDSYLVQKWKIPPWTILWPPAHLWINPLNRGEKACWRASQRKCRQDWGPPLSARFYTDDTLLESHMWGKYPRHLFFRWKNDAQRHTAGNGLKSLPNSKLGAQFHFLESMKTILHLFLKLALMIFKHQKVLESSCHEKLLVKGNENKSMNSSQIINPLKEIMPRTYAKMPIWISQRSWNKHVPLRQNRSSLTGRPPHCFLGSPPR